LSFFAKCWLPFAKRCLPFAQFTCQKKLLFFFNSCSRLLTLIAGWSAEDTFAAADYFFWIPLILPHVGGIAGAIVYHVLVTYFTNILRATFTGKVPKIAKDSDDLTAF
jgi:hypothetical protein